MNRFYRDLGAVSAVVLAHVAVFALAACPPATPAPAPPGLDASDSAAPPPAVSTPDAAPPTAPDGAAFDAANATPICVAACAAFVAAGCPQRTDCPAVLQAAQDDKLIRLPSGAPFTCKSAALVKTKADVQANGGGCTP